MSSPRDVERHLRILEARYAPTLSRGDSLTLAHLKFAGELGEALALLEGLEAASPAPRRWPICGRPTGSECDTCSRAGKPCYCDGEPGEQCACWVEGDD